MISIAGALSNLFSSISIDGSNPRDPALAKILGLGMQSKSGVQVTHEKVLALPAVIRAINIISNGMAKLPWYVFQEQKDGREYAKDHPSWKTVNRKVNKNLTVGPWKKTMTSWAMGWGNGISVIDAPNWPFGPIELVPLLPDRTKLMRYKAGGLDANLDAEGELRYYTKIGGEGRYFEPAQVIHIRGLGGSPYWGYDVVDLLSETFGGAIAKDEFSNRFFGQGANPAGFIEMPGSLEEEAEERWMDSMKKASHGLGNAHKFVLLEEGAKFHQVTIDPEKSQLLEGKTLDIRILAMAIGIKVHKLIDGANSAFASLEQVNQEHKDDDLMPWICAFREEFNDKLLTDQEKDSDSHMIDVDDEQLEWVPFRDRAAGCTELYNNGLITKEEGRRKLNWGPSKSEYGNKYRIPANITFEGEHVINGTVQPGGGTQPVEDPEDDTEETEDDSAKDFVTVSVSIMQAMRTRILKQAEAKASKNAGEFIEWLDGTKSQEAPEPIQKAVDAMVGDIVSKMNQCASTAKDDSELRAMVAESINSIQKSNLEEFLTRK